MARSSSARPWTNWPTAYRACRRSPRNLVRAAPCVDFVVEVQDGRLVRTDLEAFALAETLRLVGLTEGAAAVSAALGSSVADALAVIQPELERLVQTARPR